MAIRTSAITYTRGIQKNNKNFFFIAQANNVIPSPTSLYIKDYKIFNRNYTVTGQPLWPWRK